MQELNGSLVIANAGPTAPFRLPMFDEPTGSGNHIPQRTRGLWHTLNIGATNFEVAIPHRDAYLVVDYIGASSALLEPLRKGLQAADSNDIGARYQFKINQIVNDLSCDEPFAASINNTATHGTMNLASRGIPIYLLGMYDLKDNSVQLIWSTHVGMEQRIRNKFPLRYVFYRFPTIQDYSVSIITQAVCHGWWKWARLFSDVSSGVLTAFNALEMNIFKDPNSGRGKPWTP